MALQESVREVSRSVPVARHEPVMVGEIVDFLRPAAPALVVDGTAGGGGHLAALMAALPGSRFLAVDLDPEAVRRVEETLDDQRLEIIASGFDRIPDLLASRGLEGASAALFDLGLSSIQLDDAERGFAHSLDGPLDMRFDRNIGLPASELLDRMSEKEIADLIYTFGEEGRSRSIAREIAGARPVETTGDLARAVCRAVRGRPVKPLSRVFQALRMAVNDEPGRLARLLSGLPGWTLPGARVAFLTFHSLEDRAVKRFFIDDPAFTPWDPPWMAPSREEMRRNSRSRSAKLRMGVRS